ncbi:TATA box-binding protein-associated factor RNA polymerase I subunit B isoform X2 [Oratosquilla oratoria]
MDGNCIVCDGSQFEDRDGIRLCVECGTQKDDYMEFQSQEDTSVIDRSRFLYTKKSADSGETTDPESTICNAWTSFEAFNDILFEWTNALCSIKASPKFRHIVFKLWALYLQRLGVAFLPRQCKTNQTCSPSAGLCPSKRDVLVLHKKQKSVCSSSMSVRTKSSNKSKKLKTEKSELEKLKDKIDKNKAKLKAQGRKKSILMSHKLAHELSRTIDELDTSGLDSNTDWCRRSERLSTKSKVILSP